jgi:hypothetical protein
VAGALIGVLWAWGLARYGPPALALRRTAEGAEPTPS